MKRWFGGKKDLQATKDTGTPGPSPAVVSQKNPVTSLPTREESQDGDIMSLDGVSGVTPGSSGVDIEQKFPNIAGSTGLANPRAHSKLETLPRGNKRPKESDEMSTTLKSEPKRKRSPPLESSFGDRAQARIVEPGNTISSAPMPPPPEPPPSAEVLSVEAGEPPSSLAEYTQEEDAGQPPLKLVRDLETRAITPAQLIQEVKGIYSGLAMVEKKCMEIVEGQLKSPNKLTKEQWQALIALHRTLLNEHHDFFSASHHPVTKDHELRELAIRYAMPARMWRHGIHAFLELLRHKLPDSLEHMVSFLYLSYSMMALLKETVPEFLETWIECLGDLARYRMAIEEADLRDREIWSTTARTWYNQAADLSPNVGRIQHHLAVLARPFIVQQLYLYSKALVAAIPFRNAAESILLLFNPLLDPPTKSTTRHTPAEMNFVSAAAVLFKRQSLGEFAKFRQEFATSFQTHLGSMGSKFKVQGPEYAGSLFAMLMDFGNEKNKLWRLLLEHQQNLKKIHCEKNGQDPEKLPKDFIVQDPAIIEPPRIEYWSQAIIPVDRIEAPSAELDLLEGVDYPSDAVSSQVGPMIFQAISDVGEHIGNKNVVPFFHIVLAYLYGLSYVPGASVYTEACIPWDSIVKFLNTVGRSGVSYDIVESKGFPKFYGGSNRQLPEDFVMRGLMALTYFYPMDFFNKDQLLDEDERLLEQPSYQAPRVERCLWAAHKLALLNDRYLSYDSETKQFSTTAFSRSLLAERESS